MSADTVEAAAFQAAGLPAPGEPTSGRRLLERIIDGSQPEPPCVRRLGLPRPTESGHGRVGTTMTPTDELTWRPGVVFGGYLAGLVDQYAALAMLTVLPDGVGFLTGTVTIEFDAPVTASALRVEATVRSIDRRQATVEVTLEQEHQIACRARVHQVLKR
jgi:uncharacterized protein (TIGR00369 family)